jgi:hypothetical protein
MKNLLLSKSHLIMLTVSLGCSVRTTKKRSLAKINHIEHLGQSLGAGELSLLVVTDSVTSYSNLKFLRGTHTWSNNDHPDKPELRAT